MKAKFTFFTLFFSILLFSQIKNNQLNQVWNNSGNIPNPNTLQDKLTTGQRSLQRVSIPSDKNEVPDSGISALEKLKAEGRAEDISKRDAFSKHFPNDDGSFTAVISSGPIHFMKNGRWQDINTQISKTSGGEYAFANTDNILQSYFGKNASQGVVSKTTAGEIKEFLNAKMYWEVDGKPIGVTQATNSEIEVNGNKAIYKNIYGKINAEFSVENGLRKLNYIVPSKEALGNIPENAKYLVFYEELVVPKGWAYKENKKNISILDVHNQITFYYPNPQLFENYQRNAAYQINNNEKDTFFEVSQAGNKITFLLKVNVKWLHDNNRVYPIAIDPTVYPNNSNNWTGWATTTGGNNDDMIGGFWSDGNAIAGYSKFNLTSIPTNSVIGTAQVRMYYFARWGDLVESFFGTPIYRRRIRLVDIPLDPVPASYPTIAASPTQYISNYVQWNLSGGASQNVQHWKSFTLDLGGVAYVQDALPQGYVALAAYPYNNNSAWVADNYAWFQGYSDANKPELVINYGSCTTPSSSVNTNYIKQVDFVGSLIPDTQRTSGYTSPGYANYSNSGDPIMAQQVPGAGINVKVTTEGNNAFMKAWVDWNNDGTFDIAEKVYDTKTILTPSTVFGFVVPSGTAPGIYKIRIRTNRDFAYFLACSALNNGEAEDYKIEIIADCSAKITAVNINSTDGHRCGTGVVRVSAQGTSGTTTYHWYTSEYGGTPIHSSSNNWMDTPDISSSTTYWVTASNGSCESVARTPVVARIDPTPTITMTQTEPEVCGSTVSLKLQSSGDKEEFTLVDEKFNSGLGVFSHAYGGNMNTDARWQNRNSPYVPAHPPYYVVSPAISSGYSGGNYASSITDVAQTSNIINYLSLTTAVNTSTLLNLKLDFDLYYQPMIEGDASFNYFLVQVSTGGTWTTLDTITTTQGNPGKWAKKSYTLPNTYLVPGFRVRFVNFARGQVDTQGNPVWIGTIAALDNIRLYGDKPLSTAFSWSTPGITLYDADCATPYSGASNEVCVQATDAQIEANASWNITATATLSNGCSATGNLVLTNNNKIWNPGGAGNDWASSTDWKPSTPVPTADNCVIVKKAVNINTGTAGLAKNIVVQSGGQLNIKDGGSLTVTDFVKNEGTADDLVVENNGNLVQVNDTASNSGDITALNTFTLSDDRKQYNYVISPTQGQKIKQIYPGVPYVIYHSENANFFYNAGDGDYVAGKGFAIKEPPTTAVSTSSVQGTFKGAPYNGILNYPLSYTTNNPKAGSEHGWNLVGNPYPSNLDIKALYDDNSAKISSTFSFWDNRNNTLYDQQGSGYGGSHYAVFNAASGPNGTGTAAPFNEHTSSNPGGIIPTRYAKVGLAFMIQAQSTANGLTLDYKNSYRKTNAGPDFHGKENSEQTNDRFWLTMETPSGIKIMNAIIYFEGGNNGFAVDDTESSGGSDDFYSIVDNYQLIIQGKAPFTDTDVVPMGINAFENGIHTIALYQKEGLFQNGQDIYLNDKQTGVITKLNESSYTFLTNAGRTENRFEIIYKPSGTLGNDSVIKSKLEIYKDTGDFMVRSSENINQLEIFDPSGRLVFTTKPKSTTYRIPGHYLVNGMYVVKVTQKSGTTIKRLIK